MPKVKIKNDYGPVEVDAQNKAKTISVTKNVDKFMSSIACLTFDIFYVYPAT